MSRNQTDYSPWLQKRAGLIECKKGIILGQSSKPWSPECRNPHLAGDEKDERRRG
jgi:hypothetical protein